MASEDGLCVEGPSALREIYGELGPFAGFPDGSVSLRRISRGRIAPFASQEEALVLETVARLRIVSGYQLACLLGEWAKRRLKNLWDSGFLDRLETGMSPPLYSVGRSARRYLDVEYREYPIAEAFRVAAANQLYVVMKGIWTDCRYDPAPHDGVTAEMETGGSRYSIFAPRLFPGELLWCEEAVSLVPEDRKILIVCAAKRQAEELARYVAPDRIVRFTWDAELKKGLKLYRRFGGSLELAEEYTTAA